MIDASSTNDGLDALRAKAVSDRLAIVAPVGVDHVGVLAWSAGLAAYLREVLHHRQNQFVVVGVGWGSLNHERHAVGVNEQDVF